jgi:hypothetical protein
MGPIFFDRNVNTVVYLEIFEEFYAQLTDHERENCNLQQDGATCHMSHVSMARVHEAFTEE